MDLLNGIIDKATLLNAAQALLILLIGVAYKENVEKVREVLFSVWAKRENFLDLKNSIQYEIEFAFDEHQTEIPFPHVTLYTGSVAEPFPIRLVSNASEQSEAPS